MSLNIQGKLPQTVDDQTLRNNLDALEKGGVSTEDRQTYVDNYQRASDGSYILKSQQPAQPSPESQGAVKQANGTYRGATFGEGLMEAAKGAGNYFGSEAIGLGQSALGILGPKAPGYDVAQQAIKTGDELKKQMAPQNQAQQGGATVAQVGEIALPLAGTAADVIENGPKIISKAGDVIEGAKNFIKGGTPEEVAGKNAIKNATPNLSELTPTQRAELLKGQNINPETGLKGGTVNLTPEQTDLVKSNPELFKGKTATENYYNVDNRIAENDMAIKAHLDDQKATFDKAKLKTDLQTATKDITDPLNEKRFSIAKSKLIDNVVNTLADENSSTLLEGRQAWDKSPAIKSQLEGLFNGKETSKGLFGKAVRDTMNSTIEKSLGEGTYSDLMKQSSGLIDIRDNNLLPKALKTMNKSQLTQWIQKTPGVKQAIKLGRLGGLAEFLNATK